jgi:hypothetical protein
MNDLQTDDLVKRLKRVERMIFIWGAVAIPICISLAVAMVYTTWEARRPDSNRIVRGRSFVVVGVDGRESIRLGGYDEESGATVLEFLDGVGQRRIVVGVEKTKAPYIRLMDPAAGHSVVLDVQPKQGSAIALRNRGSRSGLLLAADSTGVSALGIMDNKGSRLLELGVNPDGTAR